MYAFYKKHEYWFIAAFVLISQLAVLPELQDRYPDTDNYTHARRVLDMLTAKSWAEIPYMHTNYPFGEILHFTRITDVFWLLFSLPAFLFFPIKEAVFWGGYIFQTGTLVLSALAFVWGAKSFAGPILRLIGVCLLFVQPSVTETYILIKPDHHALTAFFIFLITGGLLRWFADNNPKYLRIAGVSAALCLWTSIEGLLISYGLLASMCLLFLMNKTTAKSCAVYFVYYFAGALICLILNPPYEGFFFPDNGRLSFLLVVVIGLTATAMLIIAAAEEKNMLTTFWRKAFALGGTAVFFIGVLLLIYPKDVLLAPYFPPILWETWAKDVNELQPSTTSVPQFFLSSFSAVLALVSALGLYKFCPNDKRIVLTLVFIPLLFLAGLSFTAIRYARLSSLFTPYVFIAGLSLRENKQNYSDKVKSLFTALIYLAFITYLSLNYISVNRVMLSHRPPVRIVKPYIPAGEGSILSDVSSGPEIIWELDEKVIGTPYHRNVEGLIDNYFMLATDNTDDFINLLKKHRVKGILLYMELSDQPDLFYDMYRRYKSFTDNVRQDYMLLRLLSLNNLPCGVTEELNTPPPFTFLTVDFSKCKDSPTKTKD